MSAISCILECLSCCDPPPPSYTHCVVDCHTHTVLVMLLPSHTHCASDATPSHMHCASDATPSHTHCVSDATPLTHTQGYDCINRCSDHGTCHLGQCRCYHGYYGDDCSRSYAQKLLSCHNVTCLNGGTCNKSLEYGFECTCPPGLTGALCEQEIIADPCINVDCHRNGTCVRTDHGRDPKCNCYHGYEGQQCRLIKDLCLSEGRPCLNNGSCITNTTLCACPREWWGQHCENRVNFCVPINPCPQGHLCTHHNATQSYSCSCPHGYTGPTCSKLIVDHCAESPCHNNGTCVSLLDGFKCLCPRGYKGGRCKKLENPCKESPCGEGGRCRKLDEGQWGSITCECQHGYSGHFCELTA